MRNWLALIACVALVACATSPDGLKKQAPDFEYSGKTSNLTNLSECILHKVESYPILIGFSFEDKTLPVQIRQFSDNTELFQMQNIYITTYIKLTKTRTTVDANLRVANGLISRDRIVKEYSKIIQGCYQIAK